LRNGGGDERRDDPPVGGVGPRDVGDDDIVRHGRDAGYGDGARETRRGHGFMPRSRPHASGPESQWNGGDEGSTEDLRLALRQYRSFFDRLLAA
jgi:hypothetical protein